MVFRTGYLLGHESVLAIGGESSPTVMQDTVIIVAHTEVRHGERVVFAKVMPRRCE